MSSARRWRSVVSGRRAERCFAVGTMHEVLAVIPAIRADCSARRSVWKTAQHRERRFAFACSGCGRQGHVTDEPVPVLHEHVGSEGQSGFLPAALSDQASVRVSSALMRVVRPLLALEVSPSVRVARVTLGPEALHRGGRLDQAAIDAEVLTAQQPLRICVCDDTHQELPGNVVREEPILVARERAGVERLVGHVHVQDPAEEQVVPKLLAELPVAADGEQRHQKSRLQECLRRNRPTAVPAVHPTELPRHALQDLVGERFDRPKWCVDGTNVSGDTRQSMDDWLLTRPRMPRQITNEIVRRSPTDFCRSSDSRTMSAPASGRNGPVRSREAPRLQGRHRVRRARAPDQRQHSGLWPARGPAAPSIDLDHQQHRRRAGEFAPAEKRRFYRIARRSATESAAILVAVRCCELLDDLKPLDVGREQLLQIVRMLTSLATDRSGKGRGKFKFKGGR